MNKESYVLIMDAAEVEVVTEAMQAMNWSVSDDKRREKAANDILDHLYSLRDSVRRNKAKSARPGKKARS